MDIEVNGTVHALDPAWENETLLMVLREPLGLTGARYGCGVGSCGACTVLVDGAPVRSCLLRPADVSGRRITTVEGLARADGTLHPVQAAWLEERVAQCGYCQSGFMMAAAALVSDGQSPDDRTIDAALAGHVCRCGTQARIRRAIRRAAVTS